MNYLTAAGVSAGIGVVALWLLANVAHLWKSRSPARQMPEVERRFRAVFSFMTDDCRRPPIGFYMRQRDRGHQAATGLAIDHRTPAADRRWS